MQSARFKQPLQGQLLALVLVIVLTWYTVVGTSVESSLRRSSGSEESEADESNRCQLPERRLAVVQADIHFLSSTDLITESADDDEWPDIIYDEE
jgi:hypothetical protein